MIKESKLVRFIGERFKAENMGLYNLTDYIKAKRLYIYFMLGTHNPKRKNWEDFYKDVRRL